MRTADEVQALVDRCRAEGLSSPEIIARIAPACAGWPYVFGAWGEMCTPANRRKRARDDHPDIRNACPALTGGSCAGCRWGGGVRMFDCRGFTRWLLQQAGLDIIGGGATGQWNDSRNWMRRGDLREMPDAVCCLFRKRNGRMEHTGMHIGGGRVIHCSRNVEEGTSKCGGWTHYAIPKGLCSGEQIPVPAAGRTLRRGATGEDVRELQARLTARCFPCGATDGIFGRKTAAAVRAFQRAEGLTVDGICGPKTRAALERGGNP